MNRGMALVESFLVLQDEHKISEEDTRIALALGWAVELVFFLSLNCILLMLLLGSSQIPL